MSRFITEDIIRKSNEQMMRGESSGRSNVEYHDGVFYLSVKVGDSVVKDKISIEQMNEAFGREFRKYVGNGTKL